MTATLPPFQGSAKKNRTRAAKPVVYKKNNKYHIKRFSFSL